MNARKRVILAAAAALLGSGLAVGTADAAAAGAQAAPSSSGQAKAHWHHLWGPATISAGYLNQHKRWVSKTFTPDTRLTGINFYCWNNGDGGRSRVRLYNVETRKYIPLKGNTGFQYCNRQWKTIKSNGGYRVGQGLRVILDTAGKRHSTAVKAYDYHS